MTKKQLIEKFPYLVADDFSQHANGGGWKHKRSVVEDTAYLGPNAVVASENAVVSGHSMVFGKAQVYGNAMVSGHAQVYGDARVFENARIFGDARVSENARVSGKALTYEKAND